MQTRKYILLFAAIGLVAVFSMANVASAQTNQAGRQGGRFGGGMASRGSRPVVVGTVSAVNGTTLTVSGRQGFNNTNSAVTYTVDAANAKVTKNNTAGTLVDIAVGDTVAVQGTVNGLNVVATDIRDGAIMAGPRNGVGGIRGTVSSINGTTLTITAKTGPNGGTATTYTVDASKAKIMKNNISSSLSNIATGDEVVIQGTLSGTSITANIIRDGVPQIQGNGQPVVAGSVTAINGNTITINNKSNVAYTVDASAAKFVVPGVASPTISNISKGDDLVIQGTVNGNSVVASSVIDQRAKTGGSVKSQGFMGGIMGGITGFFKHLFGF